MLWKMSVCLDDPDEGHKPKLVLMEEFFNLQVLLELPELMSLSVATSVQKFR